MDCAEFKNKTVEQRIEFATKEKLCENCFSKTHTTMDCIFKLKCRVDQCGKKHHTMLHLKTQRLQDANFNNNRITEHEKTSTLLQVLPINITNGEMTIETQL